MVSKVLVMRSKNSTSPPLKVKGGAYPPIGESETGDEAIERAFPLEIALDLSAG